MGTSAAPAGREVRSLEDIAQAVVCAIKQHQVQHHTGALALPGKRWELSVRPPSLRYPGWNRRIVASGESWDSDESVGMAIEYASGPLDILVRDAKRRRGEDW